MSKAHPQMELVNVPNYSLEECRTVMAYYIASNLITPGELFALVAPLCLLAI
jgi:hypothetical protein